MTVIRSRRSESEVQFLATARELEKYTIQKCKSAIPKGYMYLVSVHLAELASDVHNLVKQGNKIYPLNLHEVQMRRDKFVEALGKLDALVAKIEVAYEIVHFEEKIMHEWSRLIDEEMRLVSAVIKKDRERYKNITQ